MARRRQRPSAEITPDPPMQVHTMDIVEDEGADIALKVQLRPDTVEAAVLPENTDDYVCRWMYAAPFRARPPIHSPLPHMQRVLTRLSWRFKSLASQLREVRGFHSKRGLRFASLPLRGEC